MNMNSLNGFSSSQRKMIMWLAPIRTLRIARLCSTTVSRFDGFPKWLQEELISNHAGETGAIEIYRGAQQGMQLRTAISDIKSDVFSFLKEQQENEASHLVLMDDIVPHHQRSHLTPLWKISGFGLGFLPSLFGGPRGIFWTIIAVETFVEEHYGDQITRLIKEGNLYPELLETLTQCCEDEVEHKVMAEKALFHGQPQEHIPAHVKLWSLIVDTGSRGAVTISKRI